MEIPDGGSVSFLKLMLDGLMMEPDDMESMMTPCHLDIILAT